MVGSDVESGRDPEMEDEMFGVDEEGGNGNNEWSLVENRKRKKIWSNTSETDSGNENHPIRGKKEEFKVFSHRMDHSALHFLIGLSVILLTRRPTYATPVIFNDSLEGSGQWDSESTDFTPTPSISSFLNESVKSTSIDGEKHSKSFLDQLVDFLQENHLPIIVITTLLLLIITIFCLAAILSRRRKVSIYYPCAFPSKMYVDERDKTGGALFFSEVLEKVNIGSSEQPVNSARQLQEDIMLATKNLRTPIKMPRKEKNETVEDQKHAEDEECVQCDKSQEESCGSLEDKTTNQSAVEDTVEKSGPSRSQDSVPACYMEKTDPSDSGPPEESKHSSGPENSEIQEDTNKQDVAASGSTFISENSILVWTFLKP